MTLYQSFTSLLVATCVSGCSGRYFRPYEHDSNATTIITRREGGLILKADPMVDLRACNTNFGMDCFRNGILPVYLMASNSDSTASYRLVTSHIWFALGHGDGSHVEGGIHQTNTSAAGSGLGVAGGVVAGVSSVAGVVLLGA